MAQFSGPSVGGDQQATVEQANNVRMRTYLTLTGNIVEHVQKDYFTFRDATGSMRVEIENEIWQGRKINPDTKVSIFGQVDSDRRGRYLSVESLKVIE